MRFGFLGTASLLVVAVSAEFMCYADNGGTFTDPYAYTYQLDCDAYLTNYPPPMFLYNAGTTPTLEACVETCSAWNAGGPAINCISVLFNKPGCQLIGNKVTDTGGAAMQFAKVVGTPPAPLPPPPISFNASCNATSGAGSFQHYIDPYGFTYYTLCGKQNQQASYRQVDASTLDPPDITGCIRACSISYLSSNTSCSGAAYDPVAGICYLDDADLGTVVDGTYNSAYILNSSMPCVFNTSSVYTTPEGDDSTIGYVNQLDRSDLLSNTTQMTACGCAEQCSLYNRAYPNVTRCAGVQYDEGLGSSPNCFVKSD